MHLLPYVDDLQRRMVVAASAGGDDARDLAERLLAPLESAVRLVLLDALSAAALEITQELAPGSVDVRLRGTDPEFVVTTPPSAEVYEPVTSPDVTATPATDDEDGVVTRTTLRLPDQLKTRMEQAAGRDGLSVNTWLVRAVSAALESPAPRPTPPPAEGRSWTGWVR